MIAVIDLPRHWNVRRLRDVAEMRVSNVDKHEKEGEITVRLCNYVDVYKNDLITERISFMRATATPAEAERFRLREGDVLMTKDSETWTDIGVPALVEYAAPDLVSGYHLALLRPRAEQVTGAFLLRALQSTSVAYQLHIAATGVTRYGLSHAAIKSVVLPIPPLPEQPAIVRFLDHSDRLIRRAIGAKQRLIALLNEQKQAVIYRTVTCGLDPDVRLKSSNVEWLGDVPEHWEVTKLARVVRRSNAGEVIDKGWWGHGSEVLYTCARHPLKSDYADFPSTKRSTGHDLLLTRNGTPYVHRPIANAIYSNVVQRINLVAGSNREWIARSLEASARRMKGYGVSIESLNYDMWKALTVLLPPKNEQVAIVQFLDETTASLDTAIDRATREIAVLREYRIRLIADVVTGKLDVREAAARLSDKDEELEPLDGAELATEADAEVERADRDSVLDEVET